MSFAKGANCSKNGRPLIGFYYLLLHYVYVINTFECSDELECLLQKTHNNKSRIAKGAFRSAWLLREPLRVLPGKGKPTVLIRQGRYRRVKTP